MPERVLASLVCAGLLGSPAVLASQQSQPLPLIVERVIATDADSVTGRPPGLEVTLYNPGPRTIHAWGIRTVVTLSYGQTRRSGLATDAYDSHSAPVVPGHCGALLPETRCTVFAGAERTVRGAADVTAPTAQVTFVILDDDTAAGDEAEIDFYFGHRARNHRAWPIIEKAITDAVSAGDPLLVLFNIREALGRIEDGETRISRAFEDIDRTLAINLKLPTVNAAGLLQTVLDDVRERRMKAEAHYQRRWR